MSLAEYLTQINNWCGVLIAENYSKFLISNGGKFIGDTVCFYAADELIERNECYETRVYCSDFITIGDDSGGRAIMINPQLLPPIVFIVDHGSMSESDFEIVSENFSDWIEIGCPLN